MRRRGTIRTTGQAPEGLSPCVCSTLRMVTRAVTQLYDDVLRPSGLRVTQFSILATLAHLGEANLKQLEERLAVDQTTLTRSLTLLERDGLIERVPHPDGRIKAMRPTVKGRRIRTSRGRSGSRRKDAVLRELGAKAWADAKRRLAHLRDVALENRNGGGCSRVRDLPRGLVCRASLKGRSSTAELTPRLVLQ